MSRTEFENTAVPTCLFSAQLFPSCPSNGTCLSCDYPSRNFTIRDQTSQVNVCTTPDAGVHWSRLSEAFVAPHVVARPD